MFDTPFLKVTVDSVIKSASEKEKAPCNDVIDQVIAGAFPNMCFGSIEQCVWQVLDENQEEYQHFTRAIIEKWEDGEMIGLFVYYWKDWPVAISWQSDPEGNFDVYLLKVGGTNIMKDIMLRALLHSMEKDTQEYRKNAMITLE